MHIAFIQAFLSFTSEVSTDAVDSMSCTVFTLEGQILNSFNIFQFLETIVIHIFFIRFFSIFVLSQSCF